MTAYTFVVLTNAEPGRDDEFNAWYDRQHVKDVLAIPGIVSAKRFRLAGVQRAKEPAGYRYLALYEIETDDLRTVVDELTKRSGSPAMPISDAMSPERFAYIYEAASGS